MRNKKEKRADVIVDKNLEEIVGVDHLFGILSSLKKKEEEREKGKEKEKPHCGQT